MADAAESAVTGAADACVFSLAGQELKLDTAEDAAPHVAQLVEHAQRGVVAVHLSGNTLGPGAAQAFASVLSTCTALRTADLSDIFTGRLISEIPTALAALCTALASLLPPGGALEEVDLSDNAFGGRSVDPLVPLLEGAHALRVLRLNNNGLGPEGGAVVAAALARGAREAARHGELSQLRVLVCGRNRLEDGSAPHWARALAAHGHLREVRMVQNGIRMRGLETLVREGLAHNPQLRILDLQDNTATLRGAKAVADTLARWPHLVDLELSETLLRPKGGQLIIDALAATRHASLARLGLAFCELSPANLRALAGVVYSHAWPALASININGNSAEEDGPELTALRTALDAHGLADALADTDEMEDPALLDDLSDEELSDASSDADANEEEGSVEDGNRDGGEGKDMSQAAAHELSFNGNLAREDGSEPEALRVALDTLTIKGAQGYPDKRDDLALLDDLSLEQPNSTPSEQGGGEDDGKDEDKDEDEDGDEDEDEDGDGDVVKGADENANEDVNVDRSQFEGDISDDSTVPPGPEPAETQPKSELVFSLEGKGLQLDSARDLEPHLRILREQAGVERVVLSGNTLGVSAAEALSATLASLTTLRSARLDDIFTQRTIEEIPLSLTALCTALARLVPPHGRLEEVDLSDNALGGRSVQPLIPLLEAAHALRVLRLANNGLGPEGGTVVADALARGADRAHQAGEPSQLQVLVCGRNRLENGSARAWSRALAALGGLEEVRLYQNGIWMEGIEAIVRQGLSANPRLKVLDLQDNTATLRGAQAVAEALPRWPDLEVLELSDLLLRSQGAGMVIDALRTAGPRKLRHLGLAFNDIPARHLEGLATLITHHEWALDHLDVNGNFAQEDGPEIGALRNALAALGCPHALADTDEMDPEGEDLSDEDGGADDDEDEVENKDKAEVQVEDKTENKIEKESMSQSQAADRVRASPIRRT